MSNGQNTTELSEREEAERRSAEMREMGFEPGEPVRSEWYGLTKEQVMESLFSSSYSNPVPVFIECSVTEARRSIVITSAKAFYDNYDKPNQMGATPPGCWEEPHWYLEGWLPASGYDPEGQTIRRVRIHTKGLDFDDFYWQLIPATPGDPDALIQVVD
ncbi:hypothetical protein AB3K78_09165 [Leucobacter sp. HNU]|uniref:hypothetical protein n=1 Tax=Leucobacter sp. HNU TaxID=3236805 RepID=UPI003A8064BE